MSSPVAEKTWVPLSAGERRVLGVLVEKAKTTPDNYPLSLNALVNGCNQKSNRDPFTNYDENEVEDLLQELRLKGAAVRIEGVGRVVRWKHTLYEWLDLRNQPVDLAVLAELLLRGPQTEGDLRARASRMEPIADLPALQAVLEGLIARGLVVRLSPPGQVRGVIVTHGLYSPEHLEKIRREFASVAPTIGEEARLRRVETGGREWEAEAAELRSEIESLRNSVQSLDAELRALKSALGS